MKIEKNIIYERTNKKPILIDAFYSEDLKNQPVVIFCHGYKGFKDWGAWNVMANEIAKSGFCYIKFNFSHNGGTMENPIDFPDLQAFGNNNYSKELDDLNDIINWVQKYFRENSSVDIDNISLIGHSRGGGICIIKSAEDQRVKKIVTLASVSDFGKRTSTVGNLQEWKDKGVKYVLNGRTNQQMPHYYQFYEDFKANEKRLHIKTSQKLLGIPQLIVHGNADTSVSINEAALLKEWNPNAELEIIDGADHVFNTKHPWEKDQLSEELLLTVRRILNFLKN